MRTNEGRWVMPVDSAAAEQRRVGRIDDRVHGLFRNVTLDESDTSPMRATVSDSRKCLIGHLRTLDDDLVARRRVFRKDIGSPLPRGRVTASCDRYGRSPCPDWPPALSRAGEAQVERRHDEQVDQSRRSFGEALRESSPAPDPRHPSKTDTAVPMYWQPKHPF